jgi:hypothetical protein
VDTATVIDFPRPGTVVGGVDDAGAAALAEIDAAIALVRAHVAARVLLTAVPFIEAVAAVGLANAQAAGVAFRLDRADRLGVATVTIGPIERALDGDAEPSPIADRGAAGQR